MRSGKISLIPTISLLGQSGQKLTTEVEMENAIMDGFADNNLLLDPIARELSDPLGQLHNASGLGAIAGLSPGGIGEQILPRFEENSPISTGTGDNWLVLEADTPMTTGLEELAPAQDLLTGILMEGQWDESIVIESAGSASQTLERSRQIAESLLTSFAAEPEFATQMNLAFGDNWDVATGNSLATAWASGDFSSIPGIEIRPGAEINGAAGAFARATNTIYISQEYLSYNADNIQVTAGVLLEEIGHAVDALVNEADSPGDEGAIFSALVRGQTLEPQQLEQMKAEDDTASITLDGQVIQIEQSVNPLYSTVGGPEGDTAQIDLGTNKGTITLSYDTYAVPDRLQLQYEGKLIFDSGFVGTRGLRTVKVPFSGNSQEVTSVMTANLDNPSTAWEYTVDADASCADTTLLNIKVVSGNRDEKDGKCIAEGIINIGLEGLGPMIKVDGRVEYDEKTISVDGIVTSLIGAGSVTTDPLLQGKFDIDVATRTASSIQETGKLPNEYKLGGLDVDFSSITLNPNGIALGANFKLLEEMGLPDYVFSGSDALLIGQDNVEFGSSIKASFPTFENFTLFNLLPIKEFFDFSIEYIAPEDLIKIQGKLSLGFKFSKEENSQEENSQEENSQEENSQEESPDKNDKKAVEFVADLAGDNFIQIQGGKADVKGELAVKNIKLPNGWGLNEAGLTIDTIKQDIGGKVYVKFPFGSIVPKKEIGAGLEMGFRLPILPQGGLNLISGVVDGLQIPIKATGAFLQKLGGQIDNLALSADDPIAFTGTVGVTAGPQFDLSAIGGDKEAALIDLEGNVTVSKEYLKGTSTIKVLTDRILKGEGSIEINWKDNFLEQKGNFSILDGFMTTTSSFRANSNLDIKMYGQATVNIPHFVPWLKGANIQSGNFLLKFSNDGDLSNDFAAGWTTVNFQRLGLDINTDLGFKSFFDGSTEVIGAKNIPETNSFIVDPGTEWIIMGADWENSNANAPVQVKAPNGNIFNESDFAATGNIAIVDELSGLTSRVVIVRDPEPGVWDINVATPVGLGNVQYSAFRDSVAPTIQITNPATDVSGGNVAINYNAFDPDSNAKISLFYDTDNEGFDGILIADNLDEEDGPGSFLWNTEGVPTGDYYIYAMIMDENNPPVFTYSPGRVRITEEADLSVTKTASADPASIGNNLTYTIAVTNNGTVESKGVTLTDILPEGATLVSSSIPPATQLDNTLTFDLGNLASGQNATINITVSPTTTGFITNTASVTSRTFDPDPTNDVDILVTTVEAIPVEPTELSISRTDSPDPVNLGEDFTYTLTVANNGTTPATDVMIAENLPSGVDFVSATASRGTTFSVGGGLSANLGTLGSGEIATVDITVNPIAAGNLVSTTSVVSNEADANTTNNFLIQSQTINPAEIAPADLELTKTVDNPSPSIGDLVNLTLTLTNQGPGIASGTQVTNLLPPELTFVSTSSNQGSYDPSTGVWNVGNIRDGLSTPLIITAIVNSGGSITSTAEITATGQADPDSTNDQASVSLNVSGGSNEFQDIFGIGDPPIVI